MTTDPRRELYNLTLAQLRPALERVASDPAFRDRLERTPLAALDEMKVSLDPALRAELTGKRFSEFWAARRKAVEGPVEIRDLPPESSTMRDEELAVVSGGISFGGLPNFAPPYVPVGPMTTGDNIAVPPPFKKK
jgi:hypothetical protein